MYSLKTGVRAVIWNQSWRRLKFPLLWNGDTDAALGCFLSKDLFEVIQRCASYAEGLQILGSQTGMCFSAWGKEGGWVCW